MGDYDVVARDGHVIALERLPSPLASSSHAPTSLLRPVSSPATSDGRRVSHAIDVTVGVSSGGFQISAVVKKAFLSCCIIGRLKQTSVRRGSPG